MVLNLILEDGHDIGNELVLHEFHRSLVAELASPLLLRSLVRSLNKLVFQVLGYIRFQAEALKVLALNSSDRRPVNLDSSLPEAVKVADDANDSTPKDVLDVVSLQVVVSQARVDLAVYQLLDHQVGFGREVLGFI